MNEKMIWRCKFCGHRVEKLTDDNFGNCKCADPLYDPEYEKMYDFVADRIDLLEQQKSEMLAMLKEVSSMPTIKIVYPALSARLGEVIKKSVGVYDPVECLQEKEKEPQTQQKHAAGRGGKG